MCLECKVVIPAKPNHKEIIDLTINMYFHCSSLAQSSISRTHGPNFPLYSVLFINHDTAIMKRYLRIYIWHSKIRGTIVVMRIWCILEICSWCNNPSRSCNNQCNWENTWGCSEFFRQVSERTIGRRRKSARNQSKRKEGKNKTFCLTCVK